MQAQDNRCPRCETVYDSAESYIRHMRLVHPGVCPMCQEAHASDRCPALMERIRQTSAGAGIARQWSRDTKRFRLVLLNLDRALWPVSAAPCAAYREMQTSEVLDRWERLVRGVEMPDRVREAVSW